MTQHSPYGSPVDQNLFKYLLEDALHILEKQVTNPESKDFKKVTHLLKRCEVFRNLFPAQAMLDDFVQLAKYYVGYEVHEYGSVLLKEKEYADKFCLILRGSVEKFRQKAYGEIENEVKEDLRRKSIMCDGSSLPHLSIPSITINNCKSHRPSKFLESSLPIQLKKLHEPEGFSLPLEGLGEEKSGLNLRLESFADEKPINETKMVTSPLGLLHLRMQAEEPSSTNECIEEDKSEESPESPEEDEVQIPLKKFVTNHVNSPPLFSNFSQMIEKFSRQASYPQETILLKGGAGDETPLVGSQVNNDEEELIRFVCENNPEIKKTYFMGDVLRASKIKSYQTGEYFGESFCRPNFPKSNSMFAVSSEKVHLLTLHREDYINIITELERRTNDKLEVFWSIFPLLDKKAVREFSQQFSQKSYHVDEVIYSKDNPSQEIYLLLSGEVKLYRESEQPNSQEEMSPSRRMASLPSHNPRGGDIPMATVIKNQFFGEELLLEKDYRQSTAIAKSPNTVTYFLDACVYEKIKEQFASFFEVLKGHAQEKFTWRQQMVSEKSEHGLLEVQRHRSLKNIISPRGSIVVADRTSPQKRSSIFLASPRQILSEKSAGSSPRSSINSFDDKKLHSEEEIQPQAQRLEAYKSQFSRRIVTIIKPNPHLEGDGAKISQRAKEEDNKEKTTAVLKKANIRKSIDLSPQFVLEEFNLRRDLYEDKKKVSHLVSPRGPNGPGHKHKKSMLTPTILPSLYDSPRGSLKPSLPKDSGSVSGFHHNPRKASITGLQNFMPTHVIFEKFTKKKNSFEKSNSYANSFVNSYENSPRQVAPAFENIHVSRKVPNQLRFK